MTSKLNHLVTKFLKMQYNFFEFFGWVPYIPTVSYSGLQRLRGVIGKETALDKLAEINGYKRRKGRWLYETNDTFRKRIITGIRG